MDAVRWKSENRLPREDRTRKVQKRMQVQYTYTDTSMTVFSSGVRQL